MKTRFLILIFLVLAVSVSVFGYVQTSFFRQERLRLIDEQIEQIAAVLYSSDLAYRKLGADEGDDLIDRMLGESSLNLLVVIREENGAVVFENENAERLRPSLALEPSWQDFETGSFYVRVLTLPLTRFQKILQVGMVMNRSLVGWSFVKPRIMIYVAIILAGVAAASLLLRRLLLRPLLAYADHVSHLSLTLESVPGVLPARASENPLIRDFARQNDELGALARGIRELTERIHRSLRGFGRLMAQLTHEMKTPLTVIRAQLESSLGEERAEAERRVQDAIQELDRLAGTVDDFTRWASLQHSPAASRELFAVPLAAVVDEVIAPLKEIHPGRIEADLSGPNLKIFANPPHVRQLITNLVVNALKYSPAGSPVRVSAGGGELRVSDSGAGIPPEVTERLGQPFNRGDGAAAGTGLGLAWVQAICSHYGWSFELRSGAGGTEAIVRFED